MVAAGRVVLRAVRRGLVTLRHVTCRTDINMEQSMVLRYIVPVVAPLLIGMARIYCIEGPHGREGLEKVNRDDES